jgi:hypothetical protein
MIINGYIRIEIGKRFIAGVDYPCTFTNGESVPTGQPFLVLGRSSEEEYLKYCVEEDLNPGMILPGCYFYKVSVD